MEKKDNDNIEGFWDFPPVIIMIFGLIAIAYFCFCYYFKINPLSLLFGILDFGLFCVWISSIRKLNLNDKFGYFIFYIALPFIIVMMGYIVWDFGIKI